jgi:hypothetical protein
MAALPTALAPLALAAGLATGLLVDAVGATGRINILAPPLLGLLIWNVAVYLLLVGSHMGAGAGVDAMSRPLRRALGRGLQRLGIDRPLDASQLAAALHAGAAAFALGALAAMYLRGIAFEYRAGWETTFLSADTVHRLLALVLGPASRLTGVPLPTAAELPALQFGRGSGENAARWIHLYAVTVLLVVVLPRTVLAIAAGRRGRRAAAIDAQPTLPVRVLPYSYRIAPQRLPALATALERGSGRRVSMSIDAPLPLGAEDDLDSLLRGPPQALAALFTLSATPESENHGAFVAALAGRTGGAPLLVLVDESDFVRRFTDAEGASRRDARRRAWQQVMQERGTTPQFVDLGP